jgi:hypothetical protein
MNWNISFSVVARACRQGRAGGRFLGVALLLLNACAMAEPPETAAEAPPVPEGAIPVAPELYMLPMGEDETGCPVFQPWSPTLMVVQALHWRTADGSFTLDRAAADCPPPDDG